MVSYDLLPFRIPTFICHHGMLRLAGKDCPWLVSIESNQRLSSWGHGYSLPSVLQDLVISGNYFWALAALPWSSVPAFRIIMQAVCPLVPGIFFWRLSFETHSHTCPSCGLPSALHTPVSEGLLDFLQELCRSCQSLGRRAGGLAW